jgi:hypothetical protein
MISMFALILASAIVASKKSEAERVSIMGDRAEELGYDRPPGLTPAWGVRKQDMRSGEHEWLPLHPKHLIYTRAPQQHWGWLSHSKWQQIVDAWVEEMVDETAEMVEPMLRVDVAARIQALIHQAKVARARNSESLNIEVMRRITTLYQDVLDDDSMVIEAPGAAISSRPIVRRFLESLLAFVRRRRAFEVSGGITTVQAHITTRMGGGFIFEIEGVQAELMRRLARRIDAVAPWRLHVFTD